MITEIIVKTEKELNLIIAINEHRFSISCNQQEISTYEGYIQTYTQKIRYNDLLLKFLATTNTLPVDLDKEINRHWYDLERDVSNSQIYIRTYEADIDRYKTAIRVYLAALEDNYKRLEIERASNRSISINDIKISLIENKNIISESIHFTYISDKPYLSFVFTGLRCTPDENKYFNMLDRDFPLRDIKVNVGLENNRFYMEPFPISERGLNPRSCSGSRIHPHVLTHDEPCLGDFLGNIVEALDNREWDVMASMIQLFFEQSYDYDEAGKYWPRFMLKACDPMVDEIFGNYKKSTINNRTFYGRKCSNIRGEYIYNIPFVQNGNIEWFKGTYHDVKELINLYIH